MGSIQWCDGLLLPSTSAYNFLKIELSVSNKSKSVNLFFRLKLIVWTYLILVIIYYILEIKSVNAVWMQANNLQNTVD